MTTIQKIKNRGNNQSMIQNTMILHQDPNKKTKAWEFTLFDDRLVLLFLDRGNSGWCRYLGIES